MRAKVALTFLAVIALLAASEIYVTGKEADRVLTGKVTDILTGEPLIGAGVILDSSTNGTTTDLNGEYSLRVSQGKHTVTVSYIGYVTVEISIDATSGITVESAPEGSVLVSEGRIDFYLSTDADALQDAVVTARKNLESLNALQSERINSGFAIENLGANEMSLKGISNAQEGVVKLSGISVADAGQLIVRGLGDRYSTTTLNGLPIASPNPDNKLIPLDIFPSSTIQNITVSKVYEASSFADYSGAHVDISTKAGDGEDFFTVSFSTGGYFGTAFQDFFQMDGNSLFSTTRLDSQAEKIAYADFASYSRSKDIFSQGFQTHKKTALPDLNGGIGFGKSFKVGDNTLNLTASASIKSGSETIRDAYYRTFEASSQGNMISEYNYNSYKDFLDLAGLFNLEYQFRGGDRIALTAFYARNAEDSYLMRWGQDIFEDYNLLGNNQVTHYYTLQDYQLSGKHGLGDWELDWGLSCSLTSSKEPDRRQVMFREVNGSYVFFDLNQQETQRYFGKLGESELAADIKAEYEWNENASLRFGLTAKSKNRDFKTSRFYYDVRGINDAIGSYSELDWIQDHMDEIDVEQYLNFSNVSNGTISIDRKQHKRDRYDASLDIAAAFVETDLHFGERWYLNAGLRFEAGLQNVQYNDDIEDKERDLNSLDLFPAVNLKYAFTSSRMLRLSLSRTVTRPSFVEMAPFLYQESFGGAQVRGNADLVNGYNYNVDLRFETFSEKNTDMFAVTGYFKYLDEPIERTQRLSGGATEHSFQNASSGIAAGIEVELRKNITKSLAFNANGSFMYTNVTLPEGGAYTNMERALQGASPYLANADLVWTPKAEKENGISLSLLYNLQGPRIHSVGIMGLGDVKQLPLHSLDFGATYRFNSRLSAKVGLKNILDSAVKFRQDIPNSNKTVDVEQWKLGLGAEIGITWNM